MTGMTARGTEALAAIIYEAGFAIDEFVAAIGTALRADNIRLGGAIQENTADPRQACSAMTLVDLAGGERVGISQKLGPFARGCRLDTRGLAELGMLLDTTIWDEIDLLILNKFGKAEAEGGGLRNVFARAIEAGIPVLTAVRPPYTEAWARFHGGLATDLAPDLDMVLAWCHRVVRQQRALRPAALASAR